MAKETLNKAKEVYELIDESDSSEDSDDEDYELGDNLFSKSQPKVGKRKPSAPKKYTIKPVKQSISFPSVPKKRKLSIEAETTNDVPIPPNTSRLFQIVIARKHARLSSCLQRSYLSLSSDDKYVTIADILSFICECAGFRPNLVNHTYLSKNPENSDGKPKKKSNWTSPNDFYWDSFEDCYSNLATSVTYQDVLNYRDKSEPDDQLFYGKDLSLEGGDSISNVFYTMCANRIKNLTKMFDGKDGWMIDFGSVAFLRFCEFFNELILQAEMQYFKGVVSLIQWVFVLSLCPYRPIRLLSCVACNEMLSSLLVKLDTLKKDQIVLKKQLSVEIELDKRTSGRMGGKAVGLSGSTLELYKRFSLVNITCRVISGFVKTVFYINYSSKAFDVYQDIRMLSAYYLVVHYLINPAIYEHQIYTNLVCNFILNEDDNLILLLKYLLVCKRPISATVVDKLLKIYPNARSEANHLVEFILVKYLSQENKSDEKDGHSNSDTNDGLKKLLSEDFVYENVLNNNSVYYCSLLLVNHFPKYQFSLKFNLNLSNIKNRYAYLLNENNRSYNTHTYSYSRFKPSDDHETARNDEKTDLDNIKILCKLLSKYQKRERFSQFLNNLVQSLVHLEFFRNNLNYLKYKNYLKFATDLDLQSVYNQLLLVVTHHLVALRANERPENAFDTNYEEKMENMEDFLRNSHEVYKLNKNSVSNLHCMFKIYKNIACLNLCSKYKLVDLIIANFSYILNHTHLTSTALNILSNMLNSGYFTSNTDNTSSDKSKQTRLDNYSSFDADKYKSKINNVFSTNLVKLIMYIDSNKKGNLSEETAKKSRKTTECEDIKLVMFTLNYFIMSFNFVTLSSDHIVKLFNLFSSNKATESSDKNTRSSKTKSDKKNKGDNEANSASTVSNVTPKDTLLNLYNELKDDEVLNLFKSNGLYSELMILYYLVYQFVIYNMVSSSSYSFEHLKELRHKLLCMMLDYSSMYAEDTASSSTATDNTGDTSGPSSSDDKDGIKLEEDEKIRKGRRVFVLLSSVFNVMKLSNSGFLNDKNRFELDKRIVGRLEECVTQLLFYAYTTKPSNHPKEGKDHLFKKKEKVVTILNDGAVTINYKYHLSSSDNNFNQKVQADASEDQDLDDGSSQSSQSDAVGASGFDSDEQLENAYLKHLTPVYIAESLTYQFTKSLNSDLFNSNMSVLFIVNSCSGVERLKKASLKYLEILNTLDLWLFNLLMLHTMFTLYELSELSLLERLVKTFNGFQNLYYQQVLYNIMQYINKSQSNEKFIRFLTIMVMGNVNLRMKGESPNGMGSPAEVNKSEKPDDNSPASEDSSSNIPVVINNEILILLKCIQVNATTGTHRYNVAKIIARVLKGNDLNDERYNTNLLLLRRSLNVKLVGKLCKHIETSIQSAPRASKTASASAPKSSKRTKPRPESKGDDTTLVSNIYDSFHDTTTLNLAFEDYDKSEFPAAKDAAGTKKAPSKATSVTGNSSEQYASALESNEDDDSPPVRNYTKRSLAPSVGLKSKISPIELRADDLDLEDVQDIEEYEPIFEGLSEGESEYPKSSCFHSNVSL